MRVELDTSILDIIVPDTYGSEFQYNIREDMWEDFKDLMILYAKDYLTDALKETIFKDAKLDNFSFHSPREYNFSTDWIKFTMEFDDKLVDIIREKANDKFFEYIKLKYKSYDGYICTMPNTKDDFFEMLGKEPGEFTYPFEKAISAWIMYEFEKEFDADQYQRDFLDSVWEYASSNGYEEDDEDEYIQAD